MNTGHRASTVVVIISGGGKSNARGGQGQVAPRLRVIAVGDDRLIGVWRDAGDGQAVRVDELVKPEQAAVERAS